MTLFRRISDSAAITAPQPSIPEEPPSQPQQQNNLGFAGTADLFENFDTNYPHAEQFSAVTQNEALPSDVTVEASSIFNQFEINQLFDNRLPQLKDKLKSLEEKKNELITEIQKETKEIQKIENAAKSVQKALASDDPIPDEVLALVGSLGIIGILGGLPVIQVLGALGIFGGLTVEYKSKAKRIQHELEQKGAEKSAAAEAMKSEMDSVDGEIQECLAAIEKENLRLEREALPAHERMHNPEMVHDPLWQEFEPVQNVIPNEENSFPFNVDPMLQKKIGK